MVDFKYVSLDHRFLQVWLIGINRKAPPDRAMANVRHGQHIPASLVNVGAL
jgi:hypothetical protein